MSLYERVVKIVENNNDNIDELYDELKALLASENKRILFPRGAIQAVEIYQDADCIIIQFYLLSVEVWVKIKKDYVNAQIYPIQKCECG
jgi:hypothetical protein